MKVGDILSLLIDGYTHVYLEKPFNNNLYSGNANKCDVYLKADVKSILTGEDEHGPYIALELE